MFRRSQEDSWRDMETINVNSHRTEETANSWSVDNEDSLGHFAEDGDLDAVDYMTFLQQSTLRERQPSQKSKPAPLPPLKTEAKDDSVVIETELEEGVTSFSANSPSPDSLKSEVSTRVMSREEEELEGLYAKVSDVRMRRAGDSRTRIGSSSTTSSMTGSSSSTNGRPPSLPPPLRMSNGSGHGLERDESDEDELHLITSQIQTLEARKSHLGSYEINRVANSPKSPLSPGLRSFFF